MVESDLGGFVLSFFGSPAVVGGGERDAVDGDAGCEARVVVETAFGGGELRYAPRVALAQDLQLRFMHDSFDRWRWGRRGV